LGRSCHNWRKTWWPIIEGKVFLLYSFCLL
jgi:hypothetical protein